MADYLVFRLYGPMASWGDISTGEVRHSTVHPSRSALLGLLGAALGVEREDEEAQQRLFASFRFGVKLVAEGSLIRDYHTVQIPRQRNKMMCRTRQQELAEKQALGTILSAREYRCDSMAVIAVEEAAKATWSLEEIKESLQRPKFILYLGRKSCPLALPLSPRFERAVSLRHALDVPMLSPAGLCSFQAERESSSEPRLLEQEEFWPTRSDKILFGVRAVRYYWEHGMDFGEDAHHPERLRYDHPLSRKRWQFLPRQEFVRLEGEVGE